MCEPVTLSATTVMMIAAVGAAMTVATGVMAMQAGKQQADAAKARSDYEMQIAYNNAIHANNVAEQARLEGAANKSDIIEQARQTASSAKVSGATRGVLVSEGSEVKTQADIEQARSHALSVEDYNTEIRVLELRQQSVNASAQGQLAFLKGRNEAAAAKSQGQMAFVSSLGSAATQFASYGATTK